jgi:hypothetical protein
MIFKDLIENQSHDYISLSLPPLRTFEELEFLLSVLKLSEYSAIKDNTAKLYVDLSIPSMLFEYSKKALPKKYLMDGLIINLFEFMSTFFNKEIFTERDYKLATEYLKTNLESVRNSIHYLNLVVKENEDVSKIVKELGVDQIIIDSQV